MKPLLPAAMIFTAAIILNAPYVRGEDEGGQDTAYSVGASFVAVPFREKQRILDTILLHYDLGRATRYSVSVLKEPGYTLSMDIEERTSEDEGYADDEQGASEEREQKIEQAETELKARLLEAAPKYEMRFHSGMTKDDLMELCIRKLQNPDDITTAWSVCGVLGSMGPEAREALPYLYALKTKYRLRKNLFDEGYSADIELSDEADRAIRKIEARK